MRDTVAVEAKKKPVALAVTQEFVELGKNIAQFEGHGNIRQVVFPFPFEGLPAEEVHRLALAAYPRFLDAIGAQR